MDSRVRFVFVQFTDYIYLSQVRGMDDDKKSQTDRWKEKHILKGKKEIGRKHQFGMCVCVLVENLSTTLITQASKPPKQNHISNLVGFATHNHYLRYRQ